MRIVTIFAAAAAIVLPAMSQAAQFRLIYTTFVDATSGPAVDLNALLTTDDGQFYGGTGYRVLSIIGTRRGQAISFDDQLFNDEVFYPSNSGGNYFDSFGLDFYVGSTVFNIRKQSPNDTYYAEFDGSTQRLVFNRAISLTPENATPSPAPEPTTWAMMLAGFGLVGAGLRRRQLALA